MVAYDASGNRVLRRSTTGSGTSITTYAFGLEEHLYGATGINTGNTYYYNLGGRIIGELTGITTLTTQFFLTDALGSVLATFSAIAGSAAVLGNQVYGPYGNQRYTQGSMGTAKGYTGQYADATGLDYYNARYYDPIVGRFVSADTVQGNEQGMDPYAYVGGNPETDTDPTGQRYLAPDGSTAWINPNGTIYGQSPGGNARIIGHTPTPTHRSNSVSAGHGNPKIVKSTQSPPLHSSTTKSSGNSIKNWGRLIAGSLKIIAGLGTIVASFLSFTNPVMATIETFARFALKNAITAIVWVINDGLRDVVASFSHVDPVVRVWTDIAAVVLDTIAVVLNAISVINFVKTVSSVGTFAAGMKKLAEGAQAFIKSGGKGKAIGSLLAAKVDILSVNGVSNMLGFAQLDSDLNTLTDDWSTLPK